MPPAGRQQREIGDAADVDDDPVGVGAREQRRVKRGHERRALPAGGDVARAKVGDDGYRRRARRPAPHC